MNKKLWLMPIDWCDCLSQCLSYQGTIIPVGKEQKVKGKISVCSAYFNEAKRIL